MEYKIAKKEEAEQQKKTKKPDEWLFAGTTEK